jgi:hypothetical protein
LDCQVIPSRRPGVFAAAHMRPHARHAYRPALGADSLATRPAPISLHAPNDPSSVSGHSSEQSGAHAPRSSPRPPASSLKASAAPRSPRPGRSRQIHLLSLWPCGRLFASTGGVHTPPLNCSRGDARRTHCPKTERGINRIEERPLANHNADDGSLRSEAVYRHLDYAVGPRAGHAARRIEHH